MKLTYVRDEDVLWIQFRGDDAIPAQRIECTSGIVVGICEEGQVVEIMIEGAESHVDFSTVELDEVFS